MPLAEVVGHGIGSAHPEYLALTPAQHGTDGFFAAVLEREVAASSLPDNWKVGSAPGTDFGGVSNSGRLLQG